MNARPLIALAVMSGIVALWWVARPNSASVVVIPLSNPFAQPAREDARPEPALPSPPPTLVPTVGEHLENIRAQLAAADAKASRHILAELRTWLGALPSAVASSEAQAFLAEGKNATTSLDLTVETGGVLGDASSLRVFLLDHLGRIDRAAAGRVAQQVLSVPTSPDEWAVALRNYAWSDNSPGAQSYLRTKAGEMIRNIAWRQDPSAGFLEAFDVIVYARGFDLTPQLTELVRNRENRAVAHAAYLTLDRLTIADPVSALGPLAAQPELMKGREKTRANFFARADVRNASQKAMLERYLLDARRPAQELQTFAGLYPNANYMISNNLLTETPPLAHAELVDRDRAALEVVDAWLADPRFTHLWPDLETVRARLRTFVQQAAVRRN